MTDRDLGTTETSGADHTQSAALIFHTYPARFVLNRSVNPLHPLRPTPHGVTAVASSSSSSSSSLSTPPHQHEDASSQPRRAKPKTSGERLRLLGTPNLRESLTRRLHAQKSSVPIPLLSPVSFSPVIQFYKLNTDTHRDVNTKLVFSHSAAADVCLSRSIPPTRIFPPV